MSANDSARDAAPLVSRGERALAKHLRELAHRARKRHGTLGPQNLDEFLNDPECLRYRTRIVFESGEMAPHQFAQPEVDPRDPLAESRVLYVHPGLWQNPAELVLAVSYLIPVINYGPSAIDDEHCCLFGAALLGIPVREYFRRICAMADMLSLIPSHTPTTSEAPCFQEPPSMPSAH